VVYYVLNKYTKLNFSKGALSLADLFWNSKYQKYRMRENVDVLPELLM